MISYTTHQLSSILNCNGLERRLAALRIFYERGQGPSRDTGSRWLRPMSTKSRISLTATLSNRASPSHLLLRPPQSGIWHSAYQTEHHQHSTSSTRSSSVSTSLLTSNHRVFIRPRSRLSLCTRTGARLLPTRSSYIGAVSHSCRLSEGRKDLSSSSIVSSAQDVFAKG